MRSCQLSRSTPAFAVLVLVLGVITPAVFPQTVTTGEITGIATDSSGAVVPTATVLLKSLDTGESRTVQSNAVGAYRFTFVTPGTYQISGASAGLKSDTGRLVVAVGQVQAVDLRLKLEEAKEVVLVTDAAPLLNTDNANLVYTFSSLQLELLPLPGGDLTAVAYSIPAVAVNNRWGLGNFASQGMGSLSNLFTLNGADEMDPYYNVNNSGATGLLLGANEVREATVIQNAYEGQYGRQAGMQVNYVSKSGTNAYHGNASYNYNGDVMNANEFFANASGTPRSHAISNQYAASLGGPVRRNKLFFFANTEGLRYAVPGYANIVSAPSPALENYTLRTIQPAQVPLYQKAFNLYNGAPGHERAVAVTNGTGLLQDSSGRLGCGALSGTPAGNGGTFGKDVSCTEAWGTNIRSRTAEWLLSTRLDYNLNARQRMFFRFKTDHGFWPRMLNPINPIFDVLSQRPDYEGQLNHTFVITPQLVNDFVGSASYYSYVFAFANLQEALQAFPSRFNIYDGGANGSYGSMASVGAPLGGFPSGRRAGQAQVVDDLSYSTGNHTFKAGLNFRYNREADLTNSAVLGGAFSFGGLDGFSSGAITSSNGSYYSQKFSSFPVLHLHLYNLGFYAQDQWAVTARFKVNATIRLDRTGNPYCADQCFSRLSRPFLDLSKGLSIPYNQSIQTGGRHAFYDSEAIVPQPRFGFVYNPSGLKTTILRGGIGLFSDLYPAFFIGRLGGNAPNLFTPVVYGGLVNTAGPGTALAIAAASANAFEGQFANGATLAQLQQAVAPAMFATPSYFSIPSTLRSSKYLEWSFEVQHQLGTQNLISVRYVGNHGYNILLNNPNANGSANRALYPNGFGGLPTAPPDSRFRYVTQLTNNGDSNYHGLSLVFRRALGFGFQGQASYTWSHALDNISNGGLVGFRYDSEYGQINPYNLRSLNYSNADYDIRHNFTGDFIWQMPFTFQNRTLNAVLGAWSLGNKLQVRGGYPFSVYNYALSMRVGINGDVLADLLDPRVHTSCGTSAAGTPCFSASQFAKTTTQTGFGNLPRNSFRGPGLFNVDSSIYKTVPVGERMRFTFGASAYNLLNRPNFADPNSNVAGAGLGLITSTIPNPSGPYGNFGGPSARALVVTGKFAF